MHQTMNWIWPLTGGGACNPIDACHESEEAVLVENEDHEWIIPPIPVSGTLNANTNGMKDRHTHALNEFVVNQANVIHIDLFECLHTRDTEHT